MKDSTKKMSKEFGWQSAEKTAHLYLNVKYMLHYIWKQVGQLGIVNKPPEEEIPPEIDEMIGILTQKSARASLLRETSPYHAKVVPLELAKDLVQVKEEVEIKNLDERIIPFKLVRDIVMKNPENIAVLNCACRMLQENPCEPIDVCMAVGDPFASFVVDHNVLGARKISSDEAVKILTEVHERGNVHCAYFKDTCGDRFYAICNCCSCCCVGMKTWNDLKLPLLASSGYVAKVSEDCTGCGTCAEMCPFSAITMDDVAVVDWEKCMGCGVCEGACPDDAIHLELDPEKGDPLDIKKLIKEHKGKSSD
jgi:NAD-dependent dihydropyrimidine dehydrogenase PreA subunit